MSTEAELIIVVEDDPSMCHALERLLDTAGLRSRSFPSAEALLASGQAAHAACLVMDIRLPGQSGFDLWRYLVDKGIDPPVIFVTGHDLPVVREQAEQAGAASYFVKPFSGRQFVNAVISATQIRRDRLKP